MSLATASRRPPGTPPATLVPVPGWHLRNRRHIAKPSPHLRRQGRGARCCWGTSPVWTASVLVVLILASLPSHRAARSAALVLGIDAAGSDESPSGLVPG